MSGQGFIGVDCGGTQCRIAWAKGDRRVEYIGAGGNFTSDPDGCAEAVRAAMTRLADKAGLSVAGLCEAPAFLGVAGVVTPDQGAALAARLPFKRAQVESDRRPVVRGALAQADGYVAAIGTGSFFARQQAGQQRFLGGWGLALGDEASGAWLGRSLLRLSLHAHDGLVPNTALTEAVLDEMGGPEALVDFASDASPADYARLAPGLAGAAEAGDAQGRVLMRTGADWIVRAIRALGWQAGAPLVLPGKLAQAYTPYLPRDVQAAVAPAEGTSLDGALALAQELPTGGA